MLYPDHHTCRLLVAEHHAHLQRLAEKTPAPTARRFTMTALAGPQVSESRRRRWLGWRRATRRAAQASPLAAIAAVALAASAFAVPTAVACPLDPADDTCLVRSTSTHDRGAAEPAKPKPKAKAKKGKQSAKPQRLLPRTLLPHRGGV